VSEVLEIPVEQISNETGPDNVETWDSLQHMNLIFALEEELEVQFSDDDIVEMLDIGLILSKVDELRTAP